MKMRKLDRSADVVLSNGSKIHGPADATEAELRAVGEALIKRKAAKEDDDDRQTD